MHKNDILNIRENSLNLYPQVNTSPAKGTDKNSKQNIAKDCISYLGPSKTGRSFCVNTT